MLKSSRQSAILANEDLKRLRASSKFRAAIKKLQIALKSKLSPINAAKEVAAVSNRFSILDNDWVGNVARTWDFKAPLPLPTEPWIDRPEMARWLKRDRLKASAETASHKFVESIGSRYHDPEFGGSETRTVPGSPKIWYKRSVIRDEEGVRYLSLNIRLTPDLSVKTLQNFVRDSLRWVEHPVEGRTKPNFFAASCQALTQIANKKRMSINQRAEWLRQHVLETHKITLSPSTAKNHVRRFEHLQNCAHT